MMKSDSKKPISLEDLLRLKRAERPPAEFWPQFERELRAKQLAAIVARRPWWSELPRHIFSSFSRYQLPLGATAVLALTFISLRQYQPAENDQALAASLKAISSASAEYAPVVENEIGAPHQVVAVAASPAFNNEVAGISTLSNADESVALAEATTSVAESRELVGDVSAMNALLGVSGSSDRENSIASTSQSLPGANFATLSSSVETPTVPAIFGEKRGFESRAMPARKVDPLANVTPPDRLRHARYVGTALPVSMPTRSPSSRSSERIVSSISDERLYESPSRYGFGGSHVGLKF